MNKLAVVMWLVACGSKDPTDRCVPTVEKIMGKGPSVAVRAEVSKSVVESCRTLTWSAEMHDCVDKAEDSKAGLRACDALLSPDQLAAVKDALMPKAVTREADRVANNATTAVAEAQARLLQLEQERKAVVDQAAKQSGGEADLERLLSSMDERIAAAEAELARAKRRRAVTPSKECLEHPLAKGCS